VKPNKGISIYLHLLLLIFSFNCSDESNYLKILNENNSDNQLTDIDGNTYKTIKIGDQIWMAENIRTTKLNDGTPIGAMDDINEWRSLKTSAYCYYNNTNDQDSINKFGVLYNYYAVSDENFAPDGWRVPTDNDWYELEIYLIKNGYNYDGTTDTLSGNINPHTIDKAAKAIAAQTDWSIETLGQGNPGHNLSLNNSTGFSALPGGYFDGYDFKNIGENGYWWTTTLSNESQPYVRSLSYDYYGLGRIYRAIDNKYFGYSVRLIKK